MDDEDREQITRALVGLMLAAIAVVALLGAAWVLGTAFRIFVEAAGLR